MCKKSAIDEKQLLNSMYGKIATYTPPHPSPLHPTPTGIYVNETDILMIVTSLMYAMDENLFFTPDYYRAHEIAEQLRKLVDDTLTKNEYQIYLENN